MHGGAGNDDLHGGCGNDTLFAEDGDDIVSGYEGDDKALGGNGNDKNCEPCPDAAFAIGPGGESLRSGADVFEGGAGRDHADYSGSEFEGRHVYESGPAVVSLDGVANDGAPGEFDNIMPDVEDLTGGLDDDILVGNDADNRIDGREGNDQVSGLGGVDVLLGGESDLGRDRLDGGRGADQLDGGPGDDRLFGGDEDDSLDGDSGSDALDGGGGNDLVQGGPGSDTSVFGGAGADEVYGANKGSQVGGDGADSLGGGEGNDQLFGGPANDTLDGGFGSDALGGGEGDDTALYTRTAPVKVTLDEANNDGEAGEQDDIAQDIEAVRGGSNQDDLFGNAAANTLEGGEGDDYIDGGPGARDQLHGDQGNDAIRARDGQPDNVDCGLGTDFAIIDTEDQVQSCDRVDRGTGKPKLGKEAVAQPQGTGLLLSLPATKRFIPLLDRVNIPFRSNLDTTQGGVKITVAARSARKARRKGRKRSKKHRTSRQVAIFSKASFTIDQKRSGTGPVDIRVAGVSQSAICASGSVKVLRAKLPSSTFRIRAFRGTVRQTKRGSVTLEVEERCSGSVTKVLNGRAVVVDSRGSHVLKKGQKYVAKRAK
jgi:Ca2+-binding RTX toxin-like protein